MEIRMYCIYAVRKKFFIFFSMKKSQAFRLESDASQALDRLALKSGRSKTAVLEYLIEQEYRKRVAIGQIPPEQDLFDLFGPVSRGEQDDKH